MESHLCRDFNFHVKNLINPDANSFKKLLSSHGFTLVNGQCHPIDVKNTETTSVHFVITSIDKQSSSKLGRKNSTSLHHS